MPSCTNDQQLCHWVSPRDTWFPTTLTNTLAQVCPIVLWGVCACSTTVYELTTMYTNDTWHQYAQEHSPLAFWIVKTWHLSWVCSIISSPCILKPKAIISSIPMCYYAKCHNISNSSLKEVTFVGKEYHIGNQWAWHFETPRDLV